MRLNERSIFSLLICAFSVLLLSQTLDMRADAALVPRVIGVPLFILSAIQLLGDLFPAMERKMPFTGPGESGQERAREDEGFSLKGNYLFIGWMVLFVLLMYLTGVIASLVIAFFIYLKLLVRQTWTLSIAYSLIFALSVYLIFVQGMGVYYFTSPSF